MFVCVTKFGTRLKFIAAIFRGSLCWPISNYVLNSCLLNNDDVPSWNLHSTKILGSLFLTELAWVSSHCHTPSFQARDMYISTESLFRCQWLSNTSLIPLLHGFYQKNRLTCRKKIQQCTWGLRIWAFRFLRLLGLFKYLLGRSCFHTGALWSHAFPLSQW